jgi:hypothetical protein
MFKNPFKTAEDYIQLRKVCDPPSMEAKTRRIVDMIIIPMIGLFTILMGEIDWIAILSTTMTVVKAWNEWIQYHELRMEMQNMYLYAMAVGGPFIVTNNTTYMPYVWADAVVRTGSPERHPVRSSQFPARRYP